MKKTMGRLLVAGGLALTATQAFAQYGGDAGQLNNFLTGSTTWLVTVLGPGVFVIGVIMVGISLAIGDQDAMRRGGYVIGGGALIFLAQAVLALIRQLAGA